MIFILLKIFSLYSCKQWKEFAEDANILKTVKFGSTDKIDESFWKKNGFLIRCASADNKRASIIIARKVLLFFHPMLR